MLHTRQVRINVVEVERVDADAYLLAEYIAQQLENIVPEIVDSNDEVEVVFEFTRGLSEIVSLTYIEISGEKARQDNGFVKEGVPEGELQKFMNSVYSGLNPSIIEFLDDSEKGTLTATITDEAGNSDSAICSYTIKNK